MNLTNSSFRICELIGILFTVTAGTLLHFVYGWSRHNPSTALISPINESTWEHMKLLFFPFLFYTLAEYLFCGWQIDNFVTAKTLGLVTGLVMIPVLFYTYSGVIGKHYLWADILVFILSVLTAFLVSRFFMQEQSLSCNRLSSAVLFILTGAFFLFSFFPPRIGLFLDPVTNTYGVWQAK